MIQKGLIKRMMKTLGLDFGTANGKFIPTKRKPLAKHVHGEPSSGNVNNRSVVGILLYLAGHTYTDIPYAVKCAAIYVFCPKLVHKHTLKQIDCI
ncbi:hypothetical protein ACHAXS_000812 [Conticribra weissflogii]